jgi:hypothetical protein
MSEIPNGWDIDPGTVRNIWGHEKSLRQAL